jgi:hypothetical protein
MRLRDEISDILEEIDEMPVTLEFRDENDDDDDTDYDDDEDRDEDWGENDDDDDDDKYGALIE